MSKKEFKPGTLLAPVPAVMISCGTMEVSNIMTVAWTGTICSDPAMVYISVRPERYSYDIIKNSKEFVINMPSTDMVRYTDLCGIISGRKTDKFTYCSLTKSKCEHIGSVYIAECPVNIECKVKETIHLGSHDMFIATVEGVLVDESLVDEQGRIEYEKAGLLVYSHGDYYALGEKLGCFGFSVRRK